MPNDLNTTATRVALVTGAARRIGKTIATALHARGLNVIIHYRNSDADAATLAAELNATRQDSARTLQADLDDPNAVRELAQQALAQWQRLDVLVNNARSGCRLGLLEETEENWNLAMTVGLTSAFFASQATIRLMAESGGCNIINVGSVAAVKVTIESPSYHAAKAGLVQLTKYLAVSGGPFHAHVNCVLPGLIVQDQHRARFNSEGNTAYRSLTNHYQPLGEVGTENDVAEAVLYLCSKRARYVSGTCLTIDGGAATQEPFGLLLRQQSKNTPTE